MLCLLAGCSRGPSSAGDDGGATTGTSSGVSDGVGPGDADSTRGGSGGPGGTDGTGPGDETGSTTGPEIPLPDPDPDWTRRGGSLSVDLQGWTNNPTIAVDDSNGRLYAAWVQYSNPSQTERAGIRVAMWDGSTWTALGGHINHADRGAAWPDAYDPSLAVHEDVPHLAWYEGGGYGWSSERRSLAFAAHWDGADWVDDVNTADPNGALNQWPLDTAARNPVLVEVAGELHALWIEHLPGQRWELDVVGAKRWSGVDWTALPALSASVDDGGQHKIIDVAGVEVDGALHVAWTEAGRLPDQDGTSTVHVARLVDDAWQPLGGPLNVDPTGVANYLAIAAASGMPYVAWQEKIAGGNYRIAVKHWDGDAWVADGEGLNDDTSAEAGRPALTGKQDRLWLAWAEGLAGQKSQLRARILDGGRWSESTGSLNRSIANGSAASPALAVLEATAYVAWVERDFPSATKQVYVAGNDMLGEAVDDRLIQYGADGPPVDPAPNTWMEVNAGGILDGAVEVGDEGYSSISYVSAIRKSLVFGKYHAGVVSYGENQNALLGYDSTRNRWDVVEITEDAWSEQLPGIGHDEGHVIVDSGRGLYYTQGNLTLHGGTSYVSYVYDLVGGRGKRLLPAREAQAGTTAVGAFDSMRNIPYMEGFAYDVAVNTWLPVSGCPTTDFAGAAYDSTHDVMIQYGGSRFMAAGDDQTWRVDLQTRACMVLQPTGGPPPEGTSHAAFNSRRGVIMVLVGAPAVLWVYDVAQSRWTSLATSPLGSPQSAAGQNLTYDSDNDLLLFHNGVRLDTLQAYRYEP